MCKKRLHHLRPITDTTHTAIAAPKWFADRSRHTNNASIQANWGVNLGWAVRNITYTPHHEIPASDNSADLHPNWLLEPTKLNWSADSWHGHTLREVEASWGAPAYRTTQDRWTTWRVGNEQGGWIIKFKTNSEGRIDTSTVHTWGTLPNQMPDELAPSA